MKITKRQLRRIIKEEKKAIAESFNSMSPRSQSLARAAARQFSKDYPDVKVGIDGREGWIIVNGKKAVNMSQASGRPLSMGDIIDQMKQAYLGHDMLSQEVPELTGGRKSSWQVRKERELGESKMKITKNQLKRIIKEEKARLLREQEESGSVNGDHHWPRVDWSNVGDLVDKWTSLEYDAWDKGDTSMNPDDVTDVEARQHWGDQVESAGLDMESELTVRIRRVALQTMKEFSDKLVNGEYS